MPELLAPAGNMEALIAAVNAGCDAVYLGMNKFGARAYAENFNLENLKEAVDYCHLHNVKIYVTMNTIIFEEELEAAYEQIRNLYLLGIDAIIIQDLALIDYVKKHTPEMEAHASTQMGLDDVEGVFFAKSIGLDRVVLGRECEIERINKIKHATNMPIEIFGHGALCVSYSGNCLMSGLIGYRSGNRGRCVGSCRKPYELINNTTGESLGESYILSMKDLQTIDYLKDFKNIDSLKIEGRMKEPSYVYNVVKNYREALDRGFVSKDNLFDLKRTFNRTYTRGYIFKEDKKNITNINKPNHHGYYVGYVSKISGKKIEIKLDLPIHQNDVIRIDSVVEINYPVVKLYDNKDNLVNVANDKAYIYLDEKVDINDKVYITKDTLFLDNIEKAIKNKYRRIPISFYLEGYIGMPLTMTVSTLDGDTSYVVSDCNLEKSKGKEVSNEFLMKQLDRLNDTPYQINHVEYTGDRNAFVPASILNELRRKAIIQLNENRLYLNRNVVDLVKDKKLNICLSERNLSVFCTTKEQYEAAKECGIKTIYFDNYVRRNEAKYDNDSEVLLVGGYGGIAYYKNKDRYLVSDFSLNVVNSRSVYLLHKNKVNRVTLSHEMNKKDISDLINQYQKNYGELPNLEMIIYGRAHLLNTKYCPLKVNNLCGLCKKNQYIIKDNYGEFPIISHEDCTTTIVNGKILNLFDDLNSIPEEVRTLRLQFTIENKNEVREIIELAKRKLSGSNEKTFNSDIHTRGHFNKEIM